MFPSGGFVVGVVCLAAVLATLSEHRGWRGYLRNLAIVFAVMLGLLAAGVLLGMVFHSAIVGEPVQVNGLVSAPARQPRC